MFGPDWSFQFSVCSGKIGTSRDQFSATQTAILVWSQSPFAIVLTEILDPVWIASLIQTGSLLKWDKIRGILLISTILHHNMVHCSLYLIHRAIFSAYHLPDWQCAQQKHSEWLIIFQKEFSVKNSPVLMLYTQCAMIYWALPKCSYSN